MTFDTTELAPSPRNGSGITRLLQIGRDWWGKARNLKGRTKLLKLCESVPLGERRLVAVMEYGSARFLIGATAGSIVLLARLPECSEQPKGTSVESSRIEGACV